MARRSTYAIVSDLMHNPGSCGCILKKFGIMLSKELTLMSSKSVKSHS